MSIDRDLVGHWPFLKDSRDHAESGLAADAVAVELIGDGPHGRGAAQFDGMSSHIEVAPHPALALGRKPFSIAAWVRCGDKYGDLLSKFDATARRGFTLRVAGVSPGYNSVSDVRSVHFGTDSGQDPTWTDHGKPWPSNTLISSLAVYEGQLYAGIADASRPLDAPSVFRFAGGSQWEHCGRLEVDPRTRSVQSMIVHEGRLYAGTGTWDWVKAKRGDSGPNHVFRYEGDRQWTDCGEFGTGRRVLSLASYHGDLYAGDDTGRVYRFDGDQKWTCCGQLGRHTIVNAMMVFQDRLYGAPHGAVFRYEGGVEWTCVGASDDPGEDLLFGERQTHTLQVFASHLWAGMWPQGKALRYEGGRQWTDCGQLGISTDQYRINEINDLTVYNGKLYAGVIPLGEVYRYERDGQWTRVRRLVHNEQMDPKDVYTWNRVTCMAVYQGRLFAGTASCHGIASAAAHPDVGRIFSMEAGHNVSFDGDLATGWRHVAAVRDARQLRLYVDGALAAAADTRPAEPLDLSNNEPLLIGLGPQSHFRGGLSDLLLYTRALEEPEISALAQAKDV